MATTGAAFNMISQLSDELTRRPPGTLGDGSLPTPGNVSPDRALLETLGERPGSMFSPMRAGEQLRSYAEPELKESVLQLSRLMQQWSSLDPEQLYESVEDGMPWLARIRRRLHRAQDPLFDAKEKLRFREVQANVMLKINEQLNMTVQQLRLLQPGTFSAEDEYGKAVGEALGDLQALPIKAAAIKQLRASGVPITTEQEEQALRSELGIAEPSALVKQNLDLVESVSKTAFVLPDEVLGQLPAPLQNVAKMARQKERDRLTKMDRDQYSGKLRGLYEDSVKDQLSALDAYGEGYFIERPKTTSALGIDFTAQTVERVPTLVALRVARMRAYMTLKGLAAEKGIGTDEFEASIGTSFDAIQSLTKEGIGAADGQ